MKKAEACLDRLFAHYRAHHEMERPLLQWMGVMGCIAFPLLYVIRHSLPNPGYDDLWLRLPAIALCLGLALRQRWPKGLMPYYIVYSWWVVFYCLSFLLAYTMLRNNGGTPFVVNMVMGAVLIVLLAEWHNTIAILLLGWTCALAAHFGLNEGNTVPKEFVVSVAGSLLLITGGALSQKGQRRVELERMRRLYASLAGSIAHEMRTPLAQVQHALRRIDADVLPHSEAAQATRQAQAAIQRGLQSISITLQQITHQNPPSLDRRGLSAERCTRKALTEFAYDSSQARACVHLRVESDFGFLGNETAFELVLFNLLKNALYYLPLNPSMEVNVTVKGGTSTPCIVVRDTGPGIPAEAMPRLFDEFNTAGKAEGTGLGLSFCRRTLRAWGGDIQCRSEHGHFTEFTLSFTPAPLAGVEHPSAPSVATPAHSLAGRTVLIVDDQPLNRTIVRAMVQEMGLNVIEAEHGQQALDMLKAGAVPDAVLMDVNMPGLDGLATTKLLRCLPGVTGSIPVFALTANDSAAAQAAAREAGMQGLLSKPIDAQTLRLVLAALL